MDVVWASLKSSLLKGAGIVHRLSWLPTSALTIVLNGKLTCRNVIFVEGSFGDAVLASVLRFLPTCFCIIVPIVDANIHNECVWCSVIYMCCVFGEFDWDVLFCLLGNSLFKQKQPPLVCGRSVTNYCLLWVPILRGIGGWPNFYRPLHVFWIWIRNRVCELVMLFFVPVVCLFGRLLSVRCLRFLCSVCVLMSCERLKMLNATNRYWCWLLCYRTSPMVKMKHSSFGRFRCVYGLCSAWQIKKTLLWDVPKNNNKTQWY